MRSESNILNDCLIALSKAGCKAFRHNVGMGWVGKSQRISHTQTVTVHAGDVIVRKARPLHAGLAKGASDIIGIKPHIVTQKDVGTTIGVFISPEIKKENGRATKEQLHWINICKN